MSTDADEAETLSPDDAFAVLGNETRMDILQTLGEADGVLSFSELRDRVGIRDSGQFNYHLDRVEGHFVDKTDEGYELRQAGRRVVEAVLSGAVTEDPVLDPSPVDESCPICGGQTVVAYSQDRVEHYCTECEGHYGIDDSSSEDAAGEGSEGTTEYGNLGHFHLPPAGLRGRSPDELFQAASTWGVLELLAGASRVCPRCSATLDESVSVCDAHDPDGEFCDQCDNRRAVQVHFECTNCIYELGGAFAFALVTNLDVLEFLIAHGINPVSPSSQAAYYAAIMDYDEEVRSVDPVEARVTFSVGDDALTLTVDDDLNVVEASR